MPLAFHPGDAFPFGGSEDWAVVAGERTKLPHSRAFIVRAYRLQAHAVLFDAPAQAFRLQGGFKDGTAPPKARQEKSLNLPPPPQRGA